MDTTLATPLLGGLSPETFMRRHWQKKPLLVRQALPGVQPPVTRSDMFALAERDEVESRLIVKDAARPAGWTLRHGPVPRRSLPPVKRPAWSLLVQGLDLHVPAARAMLERFRFVPDARLDDLMISYATEGGGVGPHLDNYDVFLIQVHGRRRWRYGRCADESFVEGVPLKLLRHFEPEFDEVLEPGDLLYLPPRWGHDGVAEGGECMTCSVGFRVASGEEFAADMLTRVADALRDEEGHLYRDPRQPATANPGRIPPMLQDFALAAVERRLRGGTALQLALGEALTEPKAHVWFQPGEPPWAGQAVRLDARTRMMYDEQHVFINGESFRAAGRDARLMALLADDRRLSARALQGLSDGARDLLAAWAEDGWLHGEPDHDGHD
jgi:50S ribosomal protein L16 3-hydroxylase